MIGLIDIIEATLILAFCISIYMLSLVVVWP